MHSRPIDAVGPARLSSAYTLREGGCLHKDLRFAERDEMIEEIKQFIHRANTREGIVYGSRPRSERLHTSGVDLMLISSRFEEALPPRCLAQLHEARNASLHFLEVTAHTSEALERAQYSLEIDRMAVAEGNRINVDCVSDGDS